MAFILCTGDADYFLMKQRVARRAQRYPTHLAVKKINGQPVADTFVVDLSAMGARLESSIPMSPRNLVEFDLLLPGADTETRFTGAVIWMKPMMSAPGRFQMGLKFFTSYWDIDMLGRTGKL
jgi:hypothetical protein